MQSRLHVGVTVWPARSDFFHFLRKWVGAHAPLEEYRKLELPPNLLSVVTRVEYSPLWVFRVALYFRVARYLENEIAAIMREAEHRYREVIFYIPDDGYWAEVLDIIRHRVGGPMRLFNVQHGQANLRTFPRAYRRMVNKVSIAMTGYPNFGYGFGAGSLDGYIVMSEHEHTFISTNFGTPAYVLPHFVRGDFFDAFLENGMAPRPPGKIRILFALSPIFGKKLSWFGIRARAEKKFFADVTACLRAVAKLGSCAIAFRVHPGQDRQLIEREFRDAGLEEISKIDENFRIVDSLAACDFVIAYGSTVLFEAALLGKVPVNFVPVAYPPGWEIKVRSETIWLRREVDGEPDVSSSRGNINDLLNQAVINEYNISQSEPDYSILLPWLVQES